MAHQSKKGRQQRSIALLIIAASIAVTTGVVRANGNNVASASPAQKANDPLGTVQALYAAFETGNMEAVRSLIAPDATWTYYGPEAVLPFAGTRKGPAGVMDFFAKVSATLTDATASQREMLVSGDTVTVPGWEESTVKTTSGHYKVANVHIFKIRDNKIVRFEEYIDSGTVAESFAVADPARGKAYFTTCSGCHGPNGEGNADMHAPPISGVPSDYILRQLRNFRAGVRGKPDDFYGYQMVGRANALPGDLATRDLVSFIATLPGPADNTTRTHDATIAKGKTAYETCAVCHGAEGEGNGDIGAPPLRRLGAWYVRTQLANFRNGLRGSDPKDAFGAQMRAALGQVPEDQDAAISAYVATLSGK
tara:strand:+ start:1032 stop:2126 length:1095 start_codon:yes stop_codon:yes gene_type:complete